MKVKYCGTYSDSSGYGSANRAFITALYIAGCDITTQLVVQMKDRANFGWEYNLCENLKDRNIDYKVKIIHLTPDCYPEYLEKGKYHIGHLFWETDRLPVNWPTLCNKMGEIWTSSEHMATLFRKSGVKVPVFAFPQPVDVSLADKNFQRFYIKNHEGLLFYAIFQWIERKNPKALLKAYWEAFRGRRDVSLLLKTFRFDYSDGEFERIRADITTWKQEQRQSHYPRILLVKDILTQEDMMRLHATGDVYVSADRGEGWSRPLAEALLLGKTAITPARGGIHEYLQDDHYFRVPSTYVPVTPDSFAKFYTGEQNWAEVDHEKLVEAFLYIYNNRIACSAKGVIARDFIRDQFNYHRIGSKMKERLEVIQKGL